MSYGHEPRQLADGSPTTFASTAARLRCGGTRRPSTPPTARASGRWRPTPRRSRCCATRRRTRPRRGGDRPYGGTLIQDLPVAGQVLNMMDDPRHARIRRLVERGPHAARRSAGVEDDLRSTRRAARSTPSTFGEPPSTSCTTSPAELPMQMICVLLGVPEADRHWLFEAVETRLRLPRVAQVVRDATPTAPSVRRA